MLVGVKSYQKMVTSLSQAQSKPVPVDLTTTVGHFYLKRTGSAIPVPLSAKL